jgi:hypothetical protein
MTTPQAQQQPPRYTEADLRNPNHPCHKVLWEAYRNACRAEVLESNLQPDLQPLLLKLFDKEFPSKA